jgi:hypothetical protein
MTDRTIVWEGFHNARDLGGLLNRAGQVTRRGAMIRSADLRFVTDAGWRAAYDAGIRTIVDLRNHDEVWPHAGVGLTELGGSAVFTPASAGPFVPDGMERAHVPLDGVEDVEFWRYLNGTRLNGTPLYFRPFIERKAERCVAAITAVARARPGGVLFHCAAGRDRTGLLALLLLALVDVDPEIIALDYELSREPLRALYGAMRREDDGPIIAEILDRKGTTIREGVLATLADFDLEAHLRAAGLADGDLAGLRSRLLT